ncbi:hypothetical protein [Gallaecimonas mangrovi]|uniref:hypothetical protein n=1 Tax=Gallaecimonas mangrovi TaxID=2291597 RepID=UPI001866F832|nr:hypothetical protein [Gallaecimonas mangrovi]
MKDESPEQPNQEALTASTKELLPSIDALGLFEVLGIREQVLSFFLERRYGTKKPA